MSKPQVNGIAGSGHSITIDHIVSYPLVSDLFNYYKSMPLGARSLEISHNVYLNFAKPVVESPLVQNPYSYVHPYAKRVDELGGETLSHIDASFPAIKETDLKSLREHAGTAVTYPFRVAGEGRDYLLSTYSDEYKKCGGPGLVPASKAIVTTELRIMTDALQRVGEWAGPKKGEAQQTLDRAKEVGDEKLSQAKSVGDEKLGQAKGVANEKAHQAKSTGDEKAHHAKKAAHHKKEELSH